MVAFRGKVPYVAGGWVGGKKYPGEKNIKTPPCMAD